MDENYSPLISSRPFTPQPIKSVKAQKLLRYLSLKNAYLALSDESWSGTVPRLFRKFFKPRLRTRKRRNLPNPYLFLGLKPFFKPKEMTPLERFKSKVSQYQTWANREFKFINPLKGRFGTKRAGSLNRHRSFLRRKNLRFLKKYSLGYSFSARRRIKKTPRKYPRIPHKLYRVTPSVSRVLIDNENAFPKLTQRDILSTRQKVYTSKLKELLVQCSPLTMHKLVSPRLNFSRIKYARLPKKLMTQRALLLLLVKLQRRSWSDKPFTRFYSLKSSHPKQKFKPKRRVRQPKLLVNMEVRKVKTASTSTKTVQRARYTATSLVKQLSSRTWNNLNVLKNPLPNNSSWGTSIIATSLLTLPSWTVFRNPTPSTVHDTVEPLASLGFLRSPFFFTNFWLSNRVGSSDVLNMNKKSYSRHSYTIFPEANAMKTAVFRHLTNQRILQQSRISIFHKKTIKSKFLSKVTPTATLSSTNNNSLYPSTSFPLSFTNILTMRRYLSSNIQKPMRYLRPKRIRFKPGYSRLWRVGRTSIKEILDIKAHYQYRLNPQLQTFYYQRRKLNRWLPAFTLEFALMKSHYAPDRDAVNSILSVNGVFLNGTVANNNKVTLFPNDFIQLIVNLKFYISLRWIRTWSLLRRNRTSKIFYRKYRPATFNKNIRVVRELPRWFFDIEFTAGDLPRYFEMDHFTLSLFVLPCHLTKDKLLSTRAYMFDARILNMYNWKYIT